MSDGPLKPSASQRYTPNQALFSIANFIASNYGYTPIP